MFSEVLNPRQVDALNELHCDQVVAAEKYQKLEISHSRTNILGPREATQSLTKTQDFNIEVINIKLKWAKANIFK